MKAEMIIAASRMARDWAGEYEDRLVSREEIDRRIDAYGRHRGFRTRKAIEELNSLTWSYIRNLIAA